MAHANFVKKAQKNIYEQGKYVKYESKKGKRAGQMLEKLDRTVPKNKTDKVFIAKGESYYYWKFQKGGIHYSKTRPRPSQLTQSNYLSQLYSIQESIEDLQSCEPQDLESFVDELKDNLQNLLDETQGSLDNMPESLQSGPTGELLQERIDSLDSAINELDSIDVNYDEPDDETLKTDIRDELSEEELTEEQWDEHIAEKRQQLAQEWVDEKMEELKNISFE